jgi:hypothetical protein
MLQRVLGETGPACSNGMVLNWQLRFEFRKGGFSLQRGVFFTVLSSNEVRASLFVENLGICS